MILQIIGLLVFWAGLFFCVVGIVGLLRFPDVYSRLHASGKVGSLGLLLLLLSAALLLPGAALRAFALAIFIILTFPAATHAIASAAHRTGAPMHEPVRDDLAAHQQQRARDAEIASD